MPRVCRGRLGGIWLCDFVIHYHDRPERIRHLYAVAKTLDETRQFRAPWGAAGDDVGTDKAIDVAAFL